VVGTPNATNKGIMAAPCTLGGIPRSPAAQAGCGGLLCTGCRCTWRAVKSKWTFDRRNSAIVSVALGGRAPAEVPPGSPSKIATSHLAAATKPQPHTTPIETFNTGPRSCTTSKRPAAELRPDTTRPPQERPLPTSNEAPTEHRPRTLRLDFEPGV
jgi:hypothetical protein